jgi:hypothetical protein
MLQTNRYHRLCTDTTLELSCDCSVCFHITRVLFKRLLVEDDEFVPRFKVELTIL